MDDTKLTRQAIAELIQELQDQNGHILSQPLERKINPLGKPNKKFLGRTINSALRHNKQKNERAQASCQQKLHELDEIHKRRKQNAFYSCFTENNLLESRTRREHRSKRKTSKHGKQCQCHRCPPLKSSIREYRCRSSSRSHTHKTKSLKQRSPQSKSTSSLSRNETDVQSTLAAVGDSTVPTSAYYFYANNMALSVAMAYGQALCAPQSENIKLSPSGSPSCDINRELFSDDEAQSNTLTIDLSLQDDQTDSCSEMSSGTISKSAIDVYLKDTDNKDAGISSNTSSDIEILEPAKKKVKTDLCYHLHF